MDNMSEDDLTKEIELKLLWLSHSLSESEKKSLERCVMELVLGNKYIDIDRERIAFNKGLMWATEYLYPRLRSNSNVK